MRVQYNCCKTSNSNIDSLLGFNLREGADAWEAEADITGQCQRVTETGGGKWRRGSGVEDFVCDKPRSEKDCTGGEKCRQRELKGGEEGRGEALPTDAALQTALRVQYDKQRTYVN